MDAAPKRYKLRYLPLFWDDLNGAVSYIADVPNNPEAATRLVDEVEAAILDHLEHLALALKYKTTRERPLPCYWFF